MLFSSKKKKQGQDSVVSSEELLNEPEEIGNNEVETKLSIHPSWQVSLEKKYVYQFLNNQCSSLKPNQISLSGIEIQTSEDKSETVVSAFVRSSLSKPVQLNDSVLLLMSEEGEVLARKKFSFGELGELPPKSSRPWNFTFKADELYVDTLPKDGWKLAFEIKKKQPHKLEMENSWEKSLSEENKESLHKLMTSIKPPKPGEVNFLGLQAKQSETGDLHITMLIRNGSEKNINLEQLPLIVEDGDGEVIAKGGFKLEDFQVKSNTSKPWTFIFPKSLLLKEDINLTKWKAYPPR